MATTKNITMKQFNGTDYDTLYPKTVYNQVSGVAPAGYGLGGTAKILTDADDLNNIKTTGWYCYHSNKHPANVPTPEVFSAVMEVIFGYYSGQTMQRVYSTGDNNDWNLVAQRVSYGSGGWQPWEWVNPPMKLGIEYRTTERYLGKPVYVKLVDCGALPNSASKSISISNDTAVKCFDVVTGTNSSGMVLPTACFGGTNLDREVAITSNGSSILIVTNFDGSSYTNTYVLVKYCKATD